MINMKCKYCYLGYTVRAGKVWYKCNNCGRLPTPEHIIANKKLSKEFYPQ